MTPINQQGELYQEAEKRLPFILSRVTAQAAIPGHRITEHDMSQLKGYASILYGSNSDSYVSNLKQELATIRDEVDEKHPLRL